MADKPVYDFGSGCTNPETFPAKALAEAATRAIEDVCRGVPPNTHLFMVGDAWMGPYELLAPQGSLEIATTDPVPGIDRLAQLAAAYPKRVWLNPIPENWWQSDTISAVGEIFPMFPMTIDGIVEAVAALLGKGDKRAGQVPRSVWANALAGARL